MNHITTTDPTKVSRMPLWLTITTVIVGFGLLSLQGAVFSHGSMSMDSWSYLSSWWNFQKGVIDPARPPVYSAIVGLLCDAVTLGYTQILMPGIQWTAYIASLQLVWIINSWFKVSKSINAIAVLSMLLIPGFWVFNDILMAESMSLSGFVLLIWLTGRYLLSRRKAYLMFSAVTLLLLVFTKPMFIFLIPIMAVVWGYASWKNRGRMLATAFSLLTVTGLLLGYAAWMRQSHGVFALAIASTHNKYCCLRADGAILPEEIKDPVAREKYLEFYRQDPGVQNPDNRYMMEVYVFTWPEVKEIVETAMENHPHAELEGLAYRFKTSMVHSQFFFYLYGYDEKTDRLCKEWNGLTENYDDGYIFPFHNYLWFPIWVTAVIWFAFSAIWIRRWIISRHFPAMAFLVSASISVCYLTALVGAQDLWGRIMTPVTPMIPVMAASVTAICLNRLRKTTSHP